MIVLIFNPLVIKVPESMASGLSLLFLSEIAGNFRRYDSSLMVPESEIVQKEFFVILDNQKNQRFEK